VNAVSTPNTDTVSLSKCFVEGITAESLNDHYSQLSTDSNYIPPALKQTVLIPNDSVTEWRVFKVLDTLRSTASGLDGLPTWFLRVGAPIFCSQLLICSICRFPLLLSYANGNKPGFALSQRLQLPLSIQTFGQYQLLQFLPESWKEWL